PPRRLRARSEASERDRSTSSRSRAPCGENTSRSAVGVVVDCEQGLDHPPPKEAAMRLQVKGKNVEVTPTIRDYAERKLAKLGKQLAEQTQVEVELSEQRNPSIADSHVAEATIFTKGPTLRAREASPDMKASIDQLAD